MNKQIAQVVVGLPVDKPFDYKIDSAFLGNVKIGHRVIVPFQMKKIIGYVVGLKDKSSFSRLRSISKVLDSEPVISNALLELAVKFAERYCCSLGEAIEVFLPTNLKKTKKAVEISADSIFLREKQIDSARSVLICGKPIGQSWPNILKEINAAISKDNGVIVLVPENSKIHEIVNQLKKEIKKEICVLDKQLKGTEELKNWVKVKNGEASIVVGTRSSVFAPVRNLGLIVIINEDSFSYKQDQSPFYHARDVAFMRSKIQSCSVVVFSQTPTAEVFSLAQSKDIDLINLYPKDNLPVQIIDISNYKPRKNSLISIPLYYAIEKTLNERGKILLLMNKKGFSSFGICAKCQYVLKCPRCDVHLTYLFHSKEVVCRQCHYKKKRPEICPNCNSGYLNFSGQGIEKLESQVARIFPSARVSCYDTDTKNFKQNSDVVIATQAVLNFQNKIFDLTAVVQIDGELNRLDYRAAHKAFSLLLHLKNLTKKQMMIQTRLTENYCIQSLVNDDFLEFYNHELSLREEIGYPPFVHIAEIVVRSVKEDAALAQADMLYKSFVNCEFEDMEIFEPQPDRIARLRDQYRFVILIKAKKYEDINKIIKSAFKDTRRKSSTITTVNIDP